MNVAGEGVGALSVRAVPKPQKRIKDKALLRAITRCKGEFVPFYVALENDY